MAVHLRLYRMGKKKAPFYRIVAADSRRARDGRFLEVVGTYDPITKPAKVELAEDKLSYWLKEGAVPSDTVKSLLTQVGFNEKYEKIRRGQDVSGIELKTEITERKKKTRQMKKAALAAAQEATKAEEATESSDSAEESTESAE